MINININLKQNKKKLKEIIDKTNNLIYASKEKNTRMS